MTNERLRSAITSAGLTHQAVSDHLGVDPKTVERWISQERVPHRTHRLRLSTLLGQDDLFLWPSTKSDPRNSSASAAEFVTLYPNRGAISGDTWTHYLTTSTESIDLLAYAASFLHDAVPDFAETLAERARAGVRLRLLFGDPGSEAIARRGAEEGIGELLAARCRLTWSYCADLLAVPGVEARTHDTTLYNSMFRFDDTLLVNVHTLGAAASHSPVLHLQRVAGGRLFTHYMTSYERAWDVAEPV